MMYDHDKDDDDGMYDEVEKDIPFKSLRAIGLPTDKRLMTSNLK